VDTVSPTHGQPGISITIFGADFRPSGISITLDGVLCDNVVVAGDGNSLNCATSSALTPGAKTIRVVNGDDTYGLLGSAYTVQGRAWPIGWGPVLTVLCSPSQLTSSPSMGKGQGREGLQRDQSVLRYVLK